LIKNTDKKAARDTSGSDKNGAHEQIRTADLTLTKGVLYQLSYMSMKTSLERAAGIEPASSAWKAEVLPMNYARAEPASLN
jgi:hypothetical protein